MRSSIRQVAARAQVSPKTVSNVLRGREGETSSETRERVLKAVHELNYVPVRSAVQNRHVETHVISVILDHSAIGWHSLDAETFSGMRVAAQRHGYDLLINLRVQSQQVGRQDAWLLDRRSDGFIFVNPLDLEGTDQALQVLKENRIPAVVTHYADRPGEVPCVVADNEMAMRLAVGHLVEKGHKNIALMCGQEWHSEARLRREGFLAAMQAFGLKVPEQHVFQTGWREENKSEAIQRLLKLYQETRGFSAVICWNDGQAVEIWEQANELGLQVPQDLSLVGMDNSALSDYRELTSITNPHHQIGDTAVETLLSLIKGENMESSSQMIPVEFVPRNSVGACARQ